MKSGESTPGKLPRCRFGGFVLDPRARELHRLDGTRVALTAKAFDVLCVLVRERDRVVGRDELFAEVWPGRVVEENTLTQAVSALRHALGKDQRWVVTVPGRGYRFVAEVALHDGRPAPAAAVLAPRPAERPHRPGAGLVLGAAWRWPCCWPGRGCGPRPGRHRRRWTDRPPLRCSAPWRCCRCRSRTVPAPSPGWRPAWPRAWAWPAYPACTCSRPRPAGAWPGWSRPRCRRPAAWAWTT